MSDTKIINDYCPEDILKIEAEQKDDKIDEVLDEIDDIVSSEFEYQSWVDEDGAGRRYDVLEIWISDRGRIQLKELLRKLLGILLKDPSRKKI